MKGKTFKTPEGTLYKVLDFDEINKMAYINTEGSRHRWVHEPEYNTWVETDIYGDFIPDIPAQMSEEQVTVSHQTTDENDVIEEDVIEEKPKRKRTIKAK